MTRKDTTPAPFSNTMVYCGRLWTDPSSHKYIVVETNEPAHFGKKLQKHHVIGWVYPVDIKDKMFTTSKNDQAVGAWDDKKAVVEWVRSDEQAARTLKARAEKSKLTSIARKAVRSIKSEYQRASSMDKVAILRAIVEELES